MPVARAIPLDEFVASVVWISQDDFGTEPMTRLLTEARLEDAEVLRHLRFDPDRYTRHLIYGTDAVEVLALAWPKGSATPIHDHAGQRCWMVAQSGVFVVDDYRQIAGTRAPGYAVVEQVRTIQNVTIGMPDFRAPGDRDIHRVALAPGCDRAVSIHIYAKPYHSCLIFDEATKEAQELAMDYDPL
jgi:predicted metal-dependent enzyme (double-stranded beta helix superfamily)